MQKKIIALAIAGLVSGGAFAQSNVTISGQMRVAIDNVRAGGATAASSDYTSRTRVTDQNSNIRFAGTESLGGGMDAWWQVESAIGTDNNTGTAASNVAGVAGNQATIGARNTAIGLKGNFGNFFIGKWDAHYNSMANVEGAGLVDGLALAASSLNILYTVNGTNTGGGRLNNVIAYQTPNMSGFTGGLIYTAGSEVTLPNMPQKDNGWNLRLAYDNGPIAVAYSYLAMNNAGAAPAQAATAAGALLCRNIFTGIISVGAATGCAAGNVQVGAALAAGAIVAASNGNDTRSNRLGFAYSFPMGFKLGLIWDKSKVSNKNNPANTSVATSTDMDRTAWALPMSYTTGAHKVSFTYAKANNVKFSGGDDGLSRKATMGMLGYEYSLSKRTSVSATYVQLNNDTAAGYDFWHGSSNVGNASAAGITAGVDPRMWSFGMKHTF